MRLRWVLILVAVVAACDDGVPEQIATAPESMSVTGPFDDGTPIPARYTCDGEDESPALQWERVPDADGYALVMTDIDADGFVHWVVWNIAPEITKIGAGEEPAGAVSGTNSFGDAGYRGPCPPEGDEPHRYEFAVVALSGDPTSGLNSGASVDDLYGAIECCVEARGELVGTYARP